MIFPCLQKKVFLPFAWEDLKSFIVKVSMYGKFSHGDREIKYSNTFNVLNQTLPC